MEIIETKEQMRDWIRYETSKYGRKVMLVKYLFPITEADVLIKHLILLRKAEYYSNSKKQILGLVSKTKLYRFQNKYSLHVPLNCCGKGLKIMHLGPVLLNGNTKLGQDVSIHVNTAFVASNGNVEAPRIDDGCVIGVGSIIIGDVYIAKNVVVGANSVVTKNFEEENIAIAGVPAKKISNNGRLSWKIVK